MEWHNDERFKELVCKSNRLFFEAKLLGGLLVKDKPKEKAVWKELADNELELGARLIEAGKVVAGYRSYLYSAQYYIWAGRKALARRNLGLVVGELDAEWEARRQMLKKHAGVK